MALAKAVTPPSPYDLIVIGGGPGGYVCAIRAAQLGLKTLCVEKAELGGTCLNWGCIPTKALIKSAELLDAIRNAERHGIKVEGLSWDFSRIIGRSRDISGRLNKGIQGLFKKYNVEHMSGHASLSSATSLDVTSGDGIRKIQARHIVIATGARSKVLPELKLDGKVVITSREAMVLPEPPKHLLVVGAGAIGLEFAYFYSAFNSKITVVEFQNSILPLNDRELSGILEKSLTRRGIEIHTGCKLDNIKISPTGIKASIVSAIENKEVASIDADVCLVAVGMTGNIEDVGLEKSGVKTEGGFIQTDPQFRTNIKTIFAIGDVSGPPLLAHKASFEGHQVAELIGGRHFEPLNKNLIPGCTYCHPQFASVGLTEEQCKAKNIDYTVGRFPFSSSGMALASGDHEGLVKLIFGKKDGKFIGAHILAAHASDLIAELGLAMNLECTYEVILATIHAHPTLSEAVQEASAQAFGQAIHI